MRCKRVGCGVVALALLLGGAEQEQGPRSGAARTAAANYDSAVKSAQNEYNRKVHAAAEVALRALEDARRAAARRGDSQEAMCIAELTKRIGDSVPPPDPASAVPQGVWHVRFLNGVDRVVRFFPDGSIAWEQGGRPQESRPKLRRVGQDLIAEIETNKIDRITVIGDRLIDEHFSPASDYPNKLPSTMGVGYR